MTAGVEIKCDVQYCPGVQVWAVVYNNIVLVRLCIDCLRKLSAGATRILEDGRRISMRYIQPGENKLCTVEGCVDHAVQYMRIDRLDGRPLEVYLCLDHDQTNEALRLPNCSILYIFTT